MCAGMRKNHQTRSNMSLEAATAALLAAKAADHPASGSCADAREPNQGGGGNMQQVLKDIEHLEPQAQPDGLGDWLLSGRDEDEQASITPIRARVYSWAL